MGWLFIVEIYTFMISILNKKINILQYICIDYLHLSITIKVEKEDCIIHFHLTFKQNQNENENNPDHYAHDDLFGY